MATRTVWIVALVLLSVACSRDAVETETTPTSTTTTATTIPSDPGRLVVLDSVGNVVVLDPDGENRIAITDDAGPNSAAYAQPVWSPDASTLAWGQVTEDGFAVGILNTTTDELTTVPTENLPFFTSWSPDGDTIGVLHNGTSGVVFRMVDVSAGTSEALDEDTPFYFTWSPEGDRVITHAGAERVESLSTDGIREPRDPTAPGYLAPQWTARGVFHIVDDQLIVEDTSGGRVAVADVSGLTMFVANPTGDMIALQSTGAEPDAVEVALAATPEVPQGDVNVVDVGSGDVATASESPAAGFFWSPDGRSLLVLEASSAGVTPLVWSAEGVVDYPSFRPPASMVQNTFPFFPQYAQSVRFWAPDSQAFTFAGQVGDESGVWVQELEDASPTRVSDGVWVAWSGPGS